MKNNAALQKDVQDAIKWEPLLNAAEIGVTVKDGVVTLTGTVDSFTKKKEAEDAAKKVAGVKAVVIKIAIKLAHWGKTTDAEIAAEVLRVLKWNWKVPNNKVKVKVEDGLITLEGDLHWNYQKEAAKTAIQNLTGVTGVTNNIKIQSERDDTIEKMNIESALRRNWSVNDDDIHVEVSGTTVTLTGTVKYCFKKKKLKKLHGMHQKFGQ